jgi:hypothetical protein
MTCAHGRFRRGGGFSLIELLLALVLGLLLCGVVVQALAADGQGLQRLVRRQRVALLQRRLIELLRSELLRAEGVTLGAAPGAACAMGGRTPVLQLQLPTGPITYSLGSPPSAIWRPLVLMRCGPAYGLDGQPSSGAAQNRVVLDQLTPDGFRAEVAAGGRLQLQLEGAAGEGPPLLTSVELAHGSP